ncbi:hypothetical protein L2E82_16331 [Cichorium intybus]|uniref:Uncharacterized protein n=1 Tax=Cichorium intybus TaxID=13427 RepID=A0ACB9F682_CICIN|nr:hypothetical protein L2E82_16331 [Cichorium intybus]
MSLCRYRVGDSRELCHTVDPALSEPEPSTPAPHAACVVIAAVPYAACTVAEPAPPTSDRTLASGKLLIFQEFIAILCSTARKKSQPSLQESIRLKNTTRLLSMILKWNP